MSIVIRQGTVSDSYAAFDIFHHAIADLSQRLGSALDGSADKAAAIAEAWPWYQLLFDHLATYNDQFWIAEADGDPIGYARSILRGTTRELTEFFVKPGRQSAGIGRDLLARAFLTEGASNRIVIATTDSRALVRYLKTGISAQFPIFGMSRRPEVVPLPATDLRVVPFDGMLDVYEQLAAIDSAILGYRRDPEHAYLMASRTGFLAVRGDDTVGYGYTGYRNGPFAALDPTDLPVLLAYAETEAAQAGVDSITFRLPMVNRTATQYLLGRGYTVEPSFALLLSDRPFGSFDRYVITNPAFFT